MKINSRTICLPILLFFTFAGRSVVAQDISFAPIEQVGREVSEAISSNIQFDISKFENYKALKSALDDLVCVDIKYGYYQVKDVVYVIGTTSQGVVIGRNLKFTAAAGKADIESISASTESCLVVPNNPDALGITVTHLLSDLPTEFHVIANLVSGRTIFVGTKTGTWKVAAGKISLMEHRDIY